MTSSKGYFCSGTIFNLSHKVLWDSEIKVLEQELDFASIQRKIIEPELRQEWNELSESFNKTPSKEKTSEGHPNLDVLLSQIERECFRRVETPLGYSNYFKEEWETTRHFTDDRNTVIENSGMSSYGRKMTILQRQKVSRKMKWLIRITFKQDKLWDLVTKSNGFVKNLRQSGSITKNELHYFSCEYKKITNLGKLYLLPKMNNESENLPERPVCTPTGKVSEFWIFTLNL